MKAVNLDEKGLIAILISIEFNCMLVVIYTRLVCIKFVFVVQPVLNYDIASPRGDHELFYYLLMRDSQYCSAFPPCKTVEKMQEPRSKAVFL